MSASELARGIRAGDVSSENVVRTLLNRIDRWNPVLNAVVQLDAERALKSARAADRARDRGNLWGPLHGVPFTAKDQFATHHLPTSYGWPQYVGVEAEQEARAVTRLREAGAILLGKTNLPFASYDWQCKHPVFGRTNNPYDLDRTPGGSSGGSAAALAAGLSPLELGADVGGSIRLPAHFCGVTGLRPTEGVLPTNGILPPDRPRTVRHIVVAGPMARTAKDVALAWESLRCPARAAAPDATPLPTADLSALRIGVTTEVGGVPVDSDTQRILQSLADTLRTAGADVAERPYPLDVEDCLDTWGHLQGYELTAGAPALVRKSPLKHALWRGWVGRQYGFLARRLHAGARLDAAAYLEAVAHRDDLAAQWDDALCERDLWITPVASIPAFRHTRIGADLTIDGTAVPYALPFATLSCATAVTGHPIVSLPAGQSRTGLPINVQLHARRRTDRRLLAAAQAVEKVLNVDLAPVAGAGA